MTDQQAGVTAVQETAPIQAAAEPNAAPAEGAADVNDNLQDGGKAKTGDPRIDDPWPNSARNKISRLSKQLNSERAQRAEFARRLQEFENTQKQQASKVKDAPPNEADYDGSAGKTYGDFLRAQIMHDLKHGQQEQGNESVDPQEIRKQALEQAQQDLYWQQRQKEVSDLGTKVSKEVPDYQQTIDEYGDVLDSLPPEVVMAFFDADNAPMAMYALAKEGKLESLAYMTPIQAAKTIALAQVRGEAMIKAGRVSKAPAPISGAKGNSAGGKSLAELKWPELKKSLNLRS